jgi:DNA-binding GntR family transcriptional regulator
VPTGTKADDIALALEEAIVSGEIAPGSVLRQEQLSERFAVSRTPVREALRRLAALGLVSFVPNRGVRVRTISRDELREAFLVRAELESLATELATPRITGEGIVELEAAERRFSQLTAELRGRAREGSQDARLIGAWVRGNHAFHDVIYAAAAAPLVERIAKSARRSFFTHLVWATGMDIDHLYEENDLQHRAIREAIAARSAQGARVLAREHVLASGRLLETILDQVQERDRERDRPLGDLRSAS